MKISSLTENPTMNDSIFKNPTPQAISVEELWLDPHNPRLGRENTRKDLNQGQVLDLMREWTLDELGISFLESGFWPQEALLCIREQVGEEERLIVIEGNRRLAALKLLFQARENRPFSQKWADIAASGSEESFERLKSVPCLEAESRQAIQAYLGFRHVTGIKEWAPAEKAEFISKLIDEQGMNYKTVMRKIGSKTPTVRQNYIAYRILLQMEDRDEIKLEQVEERFSVLFLSLRTKGVQTYLEIDINADPLSAKTPVPQDKLDHLVRFAQWLFGSEDKEPIVKDSRQVDRFGLTLESPQAIDYLENSKSPSLETAYRLAGGEESEVISLIQDAYYNIEQALSTIHLHRDSDAIQKAVKRLGSDFVQLLELFPAIRDQILEGNVSRKSK